ncbi:MAG: serine hydrolase domain-containing protein [Terriglobales bacterium]
MKLATLVIMAALAFSQSAGPRLAGTWQGTLSAGASSLHLVLHVSRPHGALAIVLDSPDQGVAALAGSDVALKGNQFSFAIPSVHGTFTGTVSADGNSIKGTWSQGVPLPLTFTRGPAAKPQPPVPLDKLQPLLDAHLEPLVGSDGLVVGVWQRGAEKMFAYGTAAPDSLFEIGSITKPFTALALAQMVEQHQLTLEEPVRQLLPPGSLPAAPPGGPITLMDLATQHSGLPRLPPNLLPGADPTDPYARYGSKQLLAYLAQQGLVRPANAPFLYSNFGFGLLGFVLAQHAGISYAELIQREVTGPLGMRNTFVVVPAAEHGRLLAGHSASGKAVSNWHFEALAGAGALRSTAGDLLTFLAAQMHPPAAGTLPRALALTHTLRADGPPGMQVGLGWLYTPHSKTYWHDGGTGGYSSFALFRPDADFAVVVLYNRQDLGSGKAPLANWVAAYVAALLTGEPAPAL